LPQCRRRQLFDEAGDENRLPVLHALCEPDFSERTSNEIACADEAPIEHRPVLPETPTFPDLKHVAQDSNIGGRRGFSKENAEPTV